MEDSWKITNEEYMELREKQNVLNTYTCGKNWSRGICGKTGKKINWNMAILVEVAELVDSLDWKHWKAGEDDIDNAKMEIVDIFHFMLSLRNDLGISEDISEVKVDYLIFIMTSPIHSIRNRIRALIAYADQKLGMSKDEIVELYVKKSELNKLRQDNGYAEGTYIKQWFGEEDNYWAKKIQGDANSTFIEKLEAFYSAVLNNEEPPMKLLEWGVKWT